MRSVAGSAPTSVKAALTGSWVLLQGGTSVLMNLRRSRTSRSTTLASYKSHAGIHWVLTVISDSSSILGTPDALTLHHARERRLLTTSSSSPCPGQRSVGRPRMSDGHCLRDRSQAGVVRGPERCCPFRARLPGPTRQRWRGERP